MGNLFVSCRKPVDLQLASVALMVPDPEKRETKGEDAFFSTVNEVGVFDGVGGWRQSGVDPGPYTRLLAELVRSSLSENDTMSPNGALQIAVTRNELPGSCTACVSSLRDAKLHVINVGDSGLMVVRNSRVIYRSKPTHRGFNHPFQLSHADSNDLVDVRPVSVNVRAGDVIIYGTDGLWDNVFERNISRAVTNHHERLKAITRTEIVGCNIESGLMERENYPATKRFKQFILEHETQHTAGNNTTANSMALSLEELAFELGEMACFGACSETQTSPFEREAKRAGEVHRGGKIDDVTIVVAVIIPVEAEPLCSSILANYPMLMLSQAGRSTAAPPEHN